MVVLPYRSGRIMIRPGLGHLPLPVLPLRTGAPVQFAETLYLTALGVTLLDDARVAASISLSLRLTILLTIFSTLSDRNGRRPQTETTPGPRERGGLYTELKP